MRDMLHRFRPNRMSLLLAVSSLFVIALLANPAAGSSPRPGLPVGTPFMRLH
ncbi:MAG: hypothetical protein L3J96_03655 [Thermoplasmata archaeon]|nr:hypothetical protein [Thermoplasmata archaeon]